MRKNNRVVVPLTGGLGNQLFQFAAGINIALGQELILETSMGKPRLNEDDNPQILDFEIPSGLLENHFQIRGNFYSKVFGYNLRCGINRSKIESNRVIKLSSKLISAIIFSIKLQSRFQILLNEGVGFSEVPIPSNNSILVGYFQSYVWPTEPEVRRILCGLRLRKPSDEISKFRQLAISEIPLVVHVRLGDYKTESNFGIPGDSYYDEAITELWETGQYKKIWLFSDEPEAAICKIPQKYRCFVRTLDAIDNSATQTFEVMRFGKGYVIANSTFSWWAAFLSYENAPTVVAPTPWFAGMNSPELLIPGNWKLKRGFT